MARTIELIQAQHIGFCYGVRRAIGLAIKSVEQKGGPLSTFGPLIHNPQEVARLADLGISACTKVEEIKGSRALVRTHGLGRAELESARRKNIELIDATCPYVKVPRKKIVEFGRAGRTVILVGDRLHPEIIAQVSYAQGPLHVVAHVEELPKLPRDTPLGIVAQTTLPSSSFTKLCDQIDEQFSDVVLADTICQDSRSRQAEVLIMAAKVDMMVVVGGRNSANTGHLASLCKGIQPNTQHIEIAEELGGIDLSQVDRVGLVSGASTPDWLVKEVISFFERVV